MKEVIEQNEHLAWNFSRLTKWGLRFRLYNSRLRDFKV